MNKTSCLQIIDYFADKTLNFGCAVKYKKNGQPYHRYGRCVGLHNGVVRVKFNDSYGSTALPRGANVIKLGHPVMLTDVLAWMDNFPEVRTKSRTGKVMVTTLPPFAWDNLLSKWGDCITEQKRKEQESGFKKDLLTIMNGSGFEKVKCDQENCQDGHYPLGELEDGEIEWGGCPKCKPHEGFPGRIEQLKQPALALFEFLDNIRNQK